MEILSANVEFKRADTGHFAVCMLKQVAADDCSTKMEKDLVVFSLLTGQKVISAFSVARSMIS